MNVCWLNSQYFLTIVLAIAIDTLHISQLNRTVAAKPLLVDYHFRDYTN